MSNVLILNRLASSKTSMISSAVPPYLSTFFIWSFNPVYM